MSIKYYAKGEHPTGFIGYRVTVGYSDKYLQRYFSTRGDEFRYQDDRCPFFKRQRLRAELQNATWGAESDWYQYQKFVNESHPSTGPFHGVGVHGLTLQFKTDRPGKWQAGIEINAPKGNCRNLGKHQHYFYTFRTRMFSEVWKKCVNLWADLNGVLDVDRERLLNTPPPPQQFRDLRRHLNDTNGNDIPVEALRPVFAEQRQSIAAQKQLKEISYERMPEPKAGAEDKSVTSDVASWFKSEVEGWKKSSA